jgi:transposase
MRQIRQVLRLHHEAGQSKRAIARSLGLSRDVVSDYLVRAAAMRITWPIPPEISDDELEQQLFPRVTPSVIRKIEPDWQQIQQELKRKGATLQGLHEEYLAEHPHHAMCYSLFCRRHREFTQTLKRSMRQNYVAGERVFVDYAGPTVKIITPKTGEIRWAQIFVGVLGASNYIYAEAHWSQSIPDWISAHTRMFTHFGAVPAVIVCDNLKSAVIHASRSDPVINATYQDMAEHYGTLILPARAYKPKDKAKAENGVLIVERWILFRLRKRVFTSLWELNEAIRSLLIDINARPFQKLAGCRLSLFETIDHPAMLPLPAADYEYAEFSKARVSMDYRIEVGGRRYTVPYQLCRREVDLRITTDTIEVLYRNKRVASHIRSAGTKDEIDVQHMPPSHRHFGTWTAEDALTWASQTGIHVHHFMERLLVGAKVKEQSYRASLSLKKLLKEYGSERLDAACGRALEIGATSLSNIRSILQNRLDLQPVLSSGIQEASFDHPNVRGSDYYR